MRAQACLGLLIAMVSVLDRAKRALVALLRKLAVLHNVALNVQRDSSDADVSSAYRKLSRKVHPDRRGGNTDDQVRSNESKGSVVRPLFVRYSRSGRR